jgi:hypothetical protein
MIKRYAAILTIVFSVMSLLFAQEKRDTVAAGSFITTQQTTGKPLAKQTRVRVPQSSWSKIKDLFM